MPVINVDWWTGNDRPQRAELVAELTSCVSRIAGCPKEAVTVIVRDVHPGYWGKGGTLADTPEAQPVGVGHPARLRDAQHPERPEYSEYLEITDHTEGGEDAEDPAGTSSAAAGREPGATP